MAAPNNGWTRGLYWFFLVLTLLALVVGSRKPIAFIPYAALVAVAGLYLVVSGGGIWRRQFAQPPSPGAFRVIGVMTIAAGIGIPAGFLIRTHLSRDPLLGALFVGSALVVLGGLITLYRRYRDVLRGHHR